VARAKPEAVEIYTDGACSGNPGPGGWGALLIFKGRERELKGMLNQARLEMQTPTLAVRLTSL